MELFTRQFSNRIDSYPFHSSSIICNNNHNSLHKNSSPSSLTATTMQITTIATITSLLLLLSCVPAHCQSFELIKTLAGTCIQVDPPNLYNNHGTVSTATCTNNANQLWYVASSFCFLFWYPLRFFPLPLPISCFLFVLVCLMCQLFTLALFV